MVFFNFYSNANRTFWEQTVETLIVRRALRRLIWVCAVCLCPTKRTLGLYGLSFLSSLLDLETKVFFVILSKIPYNSYDCIEPQDLQFYSGKYGQFF